MHTYHNVDFTKRTEASVYAYHKHGFRKVEQEGTKPCSEVASEIHKWSGAQSELGPEPTQRMGKKSSV